MNNKTIRCAVDEQSKAIRCAVDEQKSKSKVHAHEVKNDNLVITNPRLCTRILDNNSMGNQFSPSVVSDDGPYATESSFGLIQIFSISYFLLVLHTLLKEQHIKTKCNSNMCPSKTSLELL
jgi:hypothetical protein